MLNLDRMSLGRRRALFAGVAGVTALLVVLLASLPGEGGDGPPPGTSDAVPPVAVAPPPVVVAPPPPPPPTDDEVDADGSEVPSDGPSDDEDGLSAPNRFDDDALPDLTEADELGGLDEDVAALENPDDDRLPEGVAEEVTPIGEDAVRAHLTGEGRDAYPEGTLRGMVEFPDACCPDFEVHGAAAHPDPEFDDTVQVVVLWSAPASGYREVYTIAYLSPGDDGVWTPQTETTTDADLLTAPA